MTAGAPNVVKVWSAPRLVPGVARRDEPVVVEPAAGEVRECRRDGDRAAARAGVLHGRLRAVARARPVLEVPRRRAAVRIDRPVQRRRRRRHARCGAGDHRRRGQGREDPVRAAAGAGTVRRNDAIVVGRSGGEPGERPGDGDVGRAGADARARRLRAVARARPVLDVPGRRLAAGVDGAAHRRRGRADRADRAGDRGRRRRDRSCAGDDPGERRGCEKTCDPELPAHAPTLRCLPAEANRVGVKRV